MKFTRIITFTTLILFLFLNCQKSDKKEKAVSHIENNQDENNFIQSNSIADDLIDLETKNKISESKEKDMFLYFLDKPLTDFFNDAGFGHRLNEVKNTWRVYNDTNYIIIVGSVAKNDNEAHIFCAVFSDDKKGKFNMVFQKIGKEIFFGKYPKNVIPYK